MAITSTYPFVVKCDSKYSRFWVENQRTGERISKKSLTQREAFTLAEKKKQELLQQQGDTTV
ncbi:MAG: hypothetical protein ACTSYG_07240 [Candidatus Heimdallarchaeota archaeon]